MQENSPLLQLQNVGYLAGDTKILNNINFSLRAGEFKLITGPSGCGKSTLLKIVASLISPTSGTLLFEGEDVSTLKARNLPSASLLLRPDADAVWRYGIR